MDDTSGIPCASAWMRHSSSVSSFSHRPPRVVTAVSHVLVFDGRAGRSAGGGLVGAGNAGGGAVGAGRAGVGKAGGGSGGVGGELGD